MTLVKICGIQNADDAHAAAMAGAHWVGMVFFPKSPRHLSLEAAANIHREMQAILPALPLVQVALVVDADDAELDAITAAIKPDAIQCHGNESPERIAAIKARYNTVIIKALRVQSEDSLKTAEAYDGLADMMLFDSAPVAASLPGGTGDVFDWRLMKTYQGKTPWILAGGLTPANVAEAISISGAMAVDVSSGVESAPGKKDHQAIQDFISAAR
jgi:phosphoribosylanthranilate isomerase